MQYRTASFYKEFHCIGGICEDSCCENWEIDLDEISLKNYMRQKGDFGKRLKENTRVKEKQFILNGTRCPFLNDRNLCDIFIEMGEECLCETCTNFPRHIEEFENLKEVSLTMSCPEVSRIMLARKEKMTFDCEEGADEDFGLKHVEPIKSLAFWKRAHVNKLDKPLYDILFEVRQFVFEVLQNRNVPVKERAATVLMLAYEIQEFIDTKEYDKIIHKISNYKKPEKKELLDTYFAKHENRVIEKEEWMKQILNMFEGLETIKEAWTKLLGDGMRTMHGQEDMKAMMLAAGLLEDDMKESSEGNAAGRELSSFLREYKISYQEFLHYYQAKEYEFEHILVYYIFNYFLGAAYDHDAFTKVKFAVVSYLVILELDIAVWLKQKKEFLYEDQVLVAHAYSKEVEHSYNNFESLQLVLSAHPIIDVEHILIGLLS